MKPDLDKVKNHIYDWMENSLSVPSVNLNNLPLCPYSKVALLRNKLDVRSVEGEFLLQTLAEIAKSWDDQFEIIMVV